MWLFSIIIIIIITTTLLLFIRNDVFENLTLTQLVTKFTAFFSERNSTPCSK